MSDVTEILDRVNDGNDPQAADELRNAVYEELRIIARAKMKGERPGHTLQATILVNDALQRLVPDRKPTKFANRKHFFRAAAEVMRQVLVDHARRRDTLKRGKKMDMSETEFGNLAHPMPDEKILEVDDLLKKFAEKDPITVKLVELRFFTHCSVKQAAEILGISKSSAERHYRYFAAWFKREYGKNV